MNLTIKQMREIVDGAPELSPIYDLEQKKYIDREDVSIAMGFLKERFLWISNLKAKIDQHYYGQSEEKELEQYAVLSQEKIEGGAVLVGCFSNIRKMQEQQDQIAELKTQLNNMEQCYIGMKKERDALQARIENVNQSLGEMVAVSENLHSSWYVLHDAADLCKAEGIDQCVSEINKALRGEL